jgi:hypothetical protein
VGFKEVAELITEPAGDPEPTALEILDVLQKN